jgi:hypothetical protein
MAYPGARVRGESMAANENRNPRDTSLLSQFWAELDTIAGLID